MFAISPLISADGATSILTQVNWSKPTWDLFIILFFLVASLIYGLSLGRDRIMVIMVSIYMALAVVNAAPTSINVNNLFIIRISTFVGLFLVLFFLLSRSALLHSIASSDNKGTWWQAILFSILHVGLLMSVVLSFLPKASLDLLSPATKTLFVNDPAPFLWVLGPIVLMILVRGTENKKKFKYEI